MARRTNADKGKDSLELLGVKVEPALKKAIDEEGAALGIAMSTYARQLLILGWRSRHNAPIAKNPRELILTELFNDLPIREQENIIAMVEALHRKHAREAAPPQPQDPIPTELIDPLKIMTAMVKKKGGVK